MTLVTLKDTKRGKYKTRNDAQGKANRTIDGILFHSAREAKRYSELKLLEKAGEIIDLDRQIKFSLDVNGVHIADYWADFTYELRDGGTQVVEDAKGHRTREYMMKKRLMKARYGIEIQEV